MADSKKVALDSFYGVKAGMTRVFDKDGNHVPVTVIQLVSNTISQVKTSDKDGYDAYQVAYGAKREKLVNEPTKGHLKKAGISEFLTHFSEVKVEKADKELLGGNVTLDNFTAATYVDATGTTKGKGMQGVIKRFGFRGGPAAHGSDFHRQPGSIGNRATPARIFPLKKLPGHMGVKTQTVQNILVHEVNLEKGYVLLKGSVPGAKNSFVKICKAVKK